MNAAGLTLQAGFALTGVMTTLLGPLLPALIARWSLTDAQAGRLFAAQFFASTLGAASQGWIVSRLRPSWCLALSYAAMAGAAATLASGSFAAAVARVALYGFALGISNPTANLAAARSAPGRETAALNLLNMCWCAGAVAAPVALSVLLKSQPLPRVLAELAGLLAAAAVLALVFPIAVPLARDTSPASATQSGAEGAAPFRAPQPGVARAGDEAAAALRVAAFLFVYVGIENTVSGWIPAFGSRVLRLPVGAATLALALFWTSLMAARGYLAFGRRIPRAPVLLRASIGSALAGTAALSFSGGPVLLAGGAILAGAGLGPVFPGVVAIHTGRRSAARTLGLVMACAGLGGAALPWLAGVLSSLAADQRATMWTGVAATLVLAALLRAVVTLSASRDSAHRAASPGL